MTKEDILSQIKDIRSQLDKKFIESVNSERESRKKGLTEKSNYYWGLAKAYADATNKMLPLICEIEDGGDGD